MAAPEPSPAPTLDDSFPGFYPPTPGPDPPHAASNPFPPADAQADPAAALDPLTQPHDRIEGAGRALLGAAAGFVVGGPVGAAIGGGLAGLSVVEGEGIAKRFAGDRAPTPTTEEDAGVSEADTRPEFGSDAVEKEQDALASSPAQKLVGGDDAEGAKITGAGALGGALLAGAAGAKVEENEVRSPGTEDDEAERTGAVEVGSVGHSASRRALAHGVPLQPATTTSEHTPAEPAFGTPAVEKTQAALASSPAQQLLSRTDSAAAAESALLAGAAGAKGAVSNEVEEPAKAPLDVATQRAVDAGAGVGVPSPTSEPGTERQVRPTPLVWPRRWPPRLTFSTCPHHRPRLPNSSTAPLPPQPTTPLRDRTCRCRKRRRRLSRPTSSPPVRAWRRRPRRPGLPRAASGSGKRESSWRVIGMCPPQVRASGAREEEAMSTSRTTLCRW